MTEEPSPFPGELPPYNVDYQADPLRPYGSAPTLVKLAGIFNLITAALDVIYGLIMGVVGMLIGVGIIPKEAFGNQAAGGAATPPPPVGVIAGFMGAIAVFALIGGCLKLIGGTKLLKRRPGAWGWGLASGIVGSVQVWCLYFCMLPMGVGIFTIVVLCLENVRRYLNESAAQS